MKDGPFYPGDGLERIVAYHERQDERFAARRRRDLGRDRTSRSSTATELAIAAPDNPGPRTVRETGRLCYAVLEPGGDRARPPSPVRAVARAPRPGVSDTRQSRRNANGPTCERRARTRRRVLAAILGVVAIVLIVFALRGPSGPAAAAPAPKLATPLWSARRVPQSIVYDVGTQRLQAGLDADVQGLDACFAVSAPSGLVAASQADTPRIPASTQKLFTATAALDELGPEFRYETKAVATAAPKNGEVQHLWLVGSGDPGITTSEAAALARGGTADQGRPGDAAGEPG